MNPTLELLAKRRTARRYDPTPLTDEEKDSILRAAMRAPTGHNMMLYAIIEISDPAKKARLVETCNQMPFIAKAPYLLLFAGDYQRWMDLYDAAGCEAAAAKLGIPARPPGEGEIFFALMDAMIAAQTAVIAAESLGIGSCYIGNVLQNWEIHKEMFNLPRYTFPAVLVCFGRPERILRGRQTARFEPRFIVHQESYHRFDHSELDQMFLPFGGTSFGEKKYASGSLNRVQEFYLGDIASKLSTEVNRSVKEIIKDWVGDQRTEMSE